MVTSQPTRASLGHILRLADVLELDVLDGAAELQVVQAELLGGVGGGLGGGLGNLHLRTQTSKAEKAVNQLSNCNVASLWIRMFG